MLRKARAVRVYAISRQASGCPPKACDYNIDVSTDGGKTWKPAVKGWQPTRRKPEPKDWWSHSFCHGDAALDRVSGPVRLRFFNTGGMPFTRVEGHLVYEVPTTSAVKVTFAWKEGKDLKTASHTYKGFKPDKPDGAWTFTAGEKPETVWVEYVAE